MKAFFHYEASPKLLNAIIGPVLILAIFLALVYCVYMFFPVHATANPPLTWGFGVDWKNNIRQGSLDLIAGRTPYTQVIRCLPPWAYLMLAPIALLSPDLGTAVMFVLSYMVYILVLTRLKAKLLAILSFVLSFFALVNAQNGNVDFLAVLGFIMPPQIGLFFVVIKPQIVAGIAVFWLVEAWRVGKLREVLRIFGPVTAAYLISFVLYGLWPLRLAGMTSGSYNASLWPFGLPVAAALLYKAVHDRNGLFAMGAGPFLAPFTNFSSFAVTLFPFIPYPFLFMIGAALSWR